jgi:hypothetical protein
MPDEHHVTLRQADQASPEGRDSALRAEARTDFGAIESNLEFIMGQLAGGSDAEAVGAVLLAGHGRHRVPRSDLGIPISLRADCVRLHRQGR